MIYVILPLALILSGIVIWFLIKNAGRPCPMCGAPDITSFAKLDHNQRNDIYRYFDQVERRRFRQTHIFVCPKCKTVHDDFSGEKRSRDLDMIGMLKPACTSFCKCCGKILMHNASHASVVKCPSCGTQYTWTQYGGREMFFFTPQPGTQLLEKPPWTLFDG